MPVTRLLYPLYQLGNPQLRIFRPNWFLTLVRPGKEQPPDTAQFRIPMEMTKCDVKNYLEKIYNVPVGAVRTRIQFGSNKKRNHLSQKVKQPDYKVAYVQLMREEKHVDIIQYQAVKLKSRGQQYGHRILCRDELDGWMDREDQQLECVHTKHVWTDSHCKSVAFFRALKYY
uniref:Large ribosomal subunit protein uL23m n=1 Tax=Sparus aurata TaxID=8175 RepID=A0A671XJQ3_SPAAU